MILAADVLAVRGAVPPYLLVGLRVLFTIR